ncbi:MAG: 5-oxoprolinase subunit PxpB [Deltaproteobacteria bacterium]|jgi:inhibitor of KinA
MTSVEPQYRPMGDRSLLIELGGDIHPKVNQQVRCLFLALKNHRINGITDLMPGYRSILIVFDPLRLTSERVKKNVADLITHMDPAELPPPKTHRIPVVYGDEYGPDLEWVADYHHTTPEEIIRRHTDTVYHVYMIGFMPGFPYMGQLPENLVTPRRAVPRTVVPRGSVAIAEKQAGIYPVKSPGGWQILGFTPLKLFDAYRQPPALLNTGDRVQFYPIQPEDLTRWEQ